MTCTKNAPCAEHIWERHLEVHHNIERVVRICVHCGREELCWTPPQPRRHKQPWQNPASVSGSDQQPY